MSDKDKEFSQLDLGGVLRSAHEDKNSALRVTSANTSVPPKYSRVELTYNASDSVTNALFYEGTRAEEREVQFVADSSGSLNNTYFTLHSENDESLYHLWYNVSGGGTDPAPAGSVGIEINIETDDPAEIVKLATEQVLRNHRDFRTYELAPSKTKIVNTRKGLTTNSSDSGTGFGIVTTQEGAEELIKSIDVPDDGKNIYKFNTQEKKFEVFPVSSGILSGEVDIKNPNTIEMINTTIVTKNVEITQTLPDDTKRYTINVREGRGQLRLAFASGETATNYKTIRRGFIWDSYEVDVANSTDIYLLSTQDNVVVEITVWRRV